MCMEVLRSVNNAASNPAATLVPLGKTLSAEAA